MTARQSSQPGASTLTATAITEVFGDGQKLTAAIIEHDDEIDGIRLTPDCFTVARRTVTEVFTSASDDPADRGDAGRYVVIRLSAKDPEAVLREPPPARPRGPSPDERIGESELGQRPSWIPTPKYKPAVASITQTAPIYTTADAAIPPAGEPLMTCKVRDLVVEEFTQAEFRDPETGEALKYNLFVPRGYDGTTTYPLVLFMHDAGATSDDPLTTLRQGLGAIVWAQPESQAKHPCFVLAPQYPTVIVNDASQASTALETTVHLVEAIARECRVDTARIYTTGQSGGAMMSIAIDIKHPELFAASFIVAGQWDAELVAPLATQKLWILVSEGDAKAFPGQNAITAMLEQHGAAITRASWDARDKGPQLDHAAAEVASAGTSVNYTVLRKGTVVPEGKPAEPGADHIHTWHIAYEIEPIRDWIFKQDRLRS
jgi:predicted peptidase